MMILIILALKPQSVEKRLETSVNTTVEKTCQKINYKIKNVRESLKDFYQMN